jgi:integrase
MRRIRHRNGGVKKRCGCPRKAWPKCPHSWFFNFKPRDGTHYRLSLDRELGRHVESRSEAEMEAAKIRAAILAGTFRAASTPLVGSNALVLEELGRVYFGKYVSLKTGVPLSRNEQYRWNLMMRTMIQRASGARVPLGALDVVSVTRHDIESFIEVQRIPRTETLPDGSGRQLTCQRGGVVSVNRCLSRLRAVYNWAIEHDYVSSTPFKRGTATMIRLLKEVERERRLMPGEEDELLAGANPQLRALITAALETGCRIGELLSLQWRQVRWDLNEVHLPAAKTKARRPRALPMSQRLRALLDMRRHDPAGREFPPEAFVFGDETGGRVKSVKTAWENLLLRSHGHEVKRSGTGNLSPECRAKLEAIDLNFHDLRREAGSRLLEGGVPPNIVQAFLDHANLSTTSRYLKVTRQAMHVALRRYDEGRRCTSVAQGGDIAVTSSADGNVGGGDKSLQDRHFPVESPIKGA